MCTYSHGGARQKPDRRQWNTRCESQQCRHRRSSASAVRSPCSKPHINECPRRATLRITQLGVSVQAPPFGPWPDRRRARVREERRQPSDIAEGTGPTTGEIRSLRPGPLHRPGPPPSLCAGKEHIICRSGSAGWQGARVQAHKQPPPWHVTFPILVHPEVRDLRFETHRAEEGCQRSKAATEQGCRRNVSFGRYYALPGGNCI